MDLSGKEHKKAIKVRPTCEYPSQWDDLINSQGNCIATIYTVEEGKKEDLKLGITRGDDGIYDIVVHAREINNEVVRNVLKDLEKVTRRRYVFEGSSSPQDEVIAYAQKLMKPLKKYGDLEEGYDFSNAKTAKQKAEVIGIWIGEILYDALTYKDVEAVKSLTEMIMMEIEELIGKE